MQETKPFWRSKVIWVNSLALAAMILQSQFGFVFDPEAQASVIIVANLVLRAVTNSSLSITE